MTKIYTYLILCIRKNLYAEYHKNGKMMRLHSMLYFFRAVFSSSGPYIGDRHENAKWSKHCKRYGDAREK